LTQSGQNGARSFGGNADSARALPDVSTDGALEAALESLLLIVDSPVDADALAEATGEATERVADALLRLAERYTSLRSGIDLRHAGGGWRFYTRNEWAPFVERLLQGGARSKLTRAALETLAVVAYRQPVTRSRVASVRGVNVDGVVRTLLARGLIAEAGADADTQGMLYRTTELFLERLGLASLEELPPIAPLLPEVEAIDDV
jgi:segregation and condensation protein B